MATAVSTRFADEEYKNWLKVSQGLLCLRDGLCSFTNNLTRQLHQDILQKCGTANKSCTQCKAKDIEYKKQNNPRWTLKPPCPVQLCDKLLIEVADQHANGKSQAHVYWGNTNISKWTAEHWEIAKVYMGKGQKKDNHSPSDTDASNLLILIKNCKFFKSHITGPGYKRLEEVIKYRNTIMHSSTMKVTDSDMKSYLSEMISVLEDPQQLKENKEAKKAVVEMRALEQMVIDLGGDNSDWRKKEETVWKERMLAVEERLADLEERDRVREQEELFATFETFLNNNKDLQDVVSNDLQNAFGHLDKRVERIESKMEQLMTDASTGRPQATGSTGFDINGKYKETLNSYAQRNRVTDVKYEKQQDVQDGKWWSELTYAGKVYKSESSFSKSSLAEQNVAYRALKELGYYDNKRENLQRTEGATGGDQPVDRGLVPKSGSGKTTANPAAETQMEVALNKELYKLGFPKCCVQIQAQNGKVKAILKVNVTYCLGLEESIQGKKNAEQKVADRILEFLHVPAIDKTKSCKEQLYAYCGKNGLKQANYYTCEDQNKVQHFWAYAAMENLDSISREICVMGNESETEAETVSSAAEAMLKVLAGVKLGEVIGSTMVQTGHTASAPQAFSDVTGVCNLSKTTPQHPIPVQTSTASLSSSVPNYVGQLNEYCQRKHLILPDIDTEEREGKVKEFRGIVSNYKITVALSMGESVKKKEAEKEVACHTLAKVFGLSNPDKHSSKNQLQEFCVKIDRRNIPEYSVDQGRCMVTISYGLVGEVWCTDKKSAKADVAKQLLTVLEKLE